MCDADFGAGIIIGVFLGMSLISLMVCIWDRRTKRPPPTEADEGQL